MDEIRRRDREGTRCRILDTARRLFAELGYDQVTMRLISAEAGVNIALINRYFGTKRALFAEVLAVRGRFPGVLDVPREQLPRRLAEYVADLLGSREEGPVLATLSRSTVCPEIHKIVRDRVRSAILEPLAACLPAREALIGATAATALVAGAGTLRQLFGPGAFDEAGREAVVARFTKVFEACLGEASG
ncbi:TetR family transcriptional regulator [Streptosporangium sp. NPDC049376]|uniref:TetR/AcrR family transcriptional regulator n=1 Tax=Streptosporangium sp. NPDC049376 TaxID=3366192 RepID=UPI0037961780